MNAKNFFRELKRRNVHKVAIVYAVIAWLLIQVTFIPALEAPSWTIKTLVVFLVLGFAVVICISWAFEATPDGMKRTADLSPNEVLPTWSRKKFAIFILTLALLAAGLLVFDKNGQLKSPSTADAKRRQKIFVPIFRCSFIISSDSS